MVLGLALRLAVGLGLVANGVLVVIVVELVVVSADDRCHTLRGEQATTC